MSQPSLSACTLSQRPGGVCYHLPRPGLPLLGLRALRPLLWASVCCLAIVYAWRPRLMLIVLVMVLLDRRSWVELRRCGWWLLGLLGRREVTLGKDGLGSALRAGPFRCARRCPLDQVRALVLSSYDPGCAPELLAVLFGAGPIRLAGLMTPEVLRPFAGDLAARIQALDEGRAEPVGVVEEPPDDPAAPPALPARSRIAVTEREGALTFVIPPAGAHIRLLLHLAGGLLFLLVTTLVTVEFLFATPPGAVPGPGGVFPTRWVLLLGGFWLVGCAYVLGAVRDASRRVVLTVRGGMLLAEISTLFRETTRQWSREEIDAITADGLSLRIRPQEGRRFTLRYYTRLDRKTQEAECAWLADALQRALRLEKV